MIIFIVGPSYRKNSGYKIRVDRIKSHLKRRHEIRICEINSLGSIIRVVLILNSRRKSTVIMENISMSIVMLFVIKNHDWILDYHGSIYDASIKRFFWIRKRVLLYLEALVARKGRFIVVSNAFKLLLSRVYPYIKKDILVLPNIPLHKRPKVVYTPRTDLELVYAGGIQSWQMIPQLIEFVHALGHFYNGQVHFKILTGNVKEFEYRLSARKDLSFSYTVKTVSPEKVLDEVELSDFALMLREENWINRVACPTKAIEYLMTTTPLIVSENLGDISDIVNDKDKGIIICGDWKNQDNLRRIVDYYREGKRHKITLAAFSSEVYNDLIEFI